METQEYDVVVIGGGAAGENAAWYAADNGLSTVLVEADLVGGECTFWACMPSKALLRPGEVLAAARRVPGAAPAVTGPVDVEAALVSRDAFAARWDDAGQVAWLEGVGIRLVRGHGRLGGARTVDVETGEGEVVTLHARSAVVLATGSKPRQPPVEGLDQVRPWTSREATSAKEIPRRLLIVGGGVVAVEMAQAMRWLGSEEVTIVQRAERILSGEEPVASEQVHTALEELGVEILTNAEAVRARRDGEDGPVTVELDSGREVVADELLLAVGREPNTADLRLESVGIDPAAGLDVDEQLRVRGVDGGWLYAVGDVNDLAQLTHQGKYQARLVGDIVAGRERSDWATRHALPRVIFTDPQVAAVGLTEAQAREQGVAVKVLRVALRDTAGAALLGADVDGTAQLVVDVDRQVIVGATFTGPGAGELLHAATIAIVGEVVLDRLWHAVPAFPTLSEVWLRLLEAARGLD